MLRVLLTAISLFVATRAHGQSKMAIWINGQLVGHGSMRNEVDSAGRMHQYVQSTIQIGDVTREMKDESVADKTGLPISETETDVMGGQTTKLVLTFGKKEMTIRLTAGGKTNVLRVPIPKGNLADASTFWFITTTPKVGDKATYLHYDFSSATWKKRSSEYVGDEVVPGTTIKGHHIAHEDGSEWVDDKGIQIRTENKMENGVILLGIRE